MIDYLDQEYYPQVIVEITKNKVIMCDGKNQNINNPIHLYSVLMARKRYESDLELVHKVIAEENEKEQELDDLVAESQYMLLSNIIYPNNKNGDNKYTTNMYLQYALGIMRFTVDDIYNVLPKFFEHGTLDLNNGQLVDKSQFNNKIPHLQDNAYNQLSGKFDKFQAN